jgi:hypothetical protein
MFLVQKKGEITVLAGRRNAASRVALLDKTLAKILPWDRFLDAVEWKSCEKSKILIIEINMVFHIIKNIIKRKVKCNVDRKRANQFPTDFGETNNC